MVALHASLATPPRSAQGHDLRRVQDFEALTPNLLARTMETVEGGGVVVLLLSTLRSLTQLFTLSMDVHARLRTESHQEVTGAAHAELPGGAPGACTGMRAARRHLFTPGRHGSGGGMVHAGCVLAAARLRAAAPRLC